MVGWLCGSLACWLAGFLARLLASLLVCLADHFSSISQKRICLNNCMSCDTEIDVARYARTGPEHKQIIKKSRGEKYMFCRFLSSFGGTLLCSSFAQNL